MTSAPVAAPAAATADKPPRTAAQLRDDLARAKQRLAENLDVLVTEVHPQAVAIHAKEEARAFAQTQFAEAKQQVKDEYGWRVDRFLIVGGAVLGAVTFLLVVRAIANRAQKP